MGAVTRGKKERELGAYVERIVTSAMQWSIPETWVNLKKWNPFTFSIKNRGYK